MFSFYYNTIQSPEHVFLLFIYKILLSIYEHLCSNLQFISLPEEVGEFLLYIMLKRFPGDLLKLPMFYFFAVFLLLWIFFEKKNLKALLSILLVWRMGMPHTRLYTSNGRKWNPKSIQRCDWKRQDLSGRRQHRPDTQIYPGIL